MALTVLTALIVHIYAAIPTGRLTGSAYAVVISYELVKIAVFFSLAWFITAKFLERAASRISPVRTAIGALLMAVLIFVLARSAIGTLGALAWSFVAGLVMNRGEAGKRLKERGQSPAMSVLLSFAFLPLLIQAHGRGLTNATLVLAGVIAALTCKFATVWIGARVGGASTSEARVTAAAALASGEMAVIFLGLGVTRWMIDGQFYFGILVYAFASMALGQTLLRSFVSSNNSSPEAASADARPPKEKRKRRASTPGQAVISAVIVAVSLTVFGSIALAQSSEGDPVRRAMERIGEVVNDRSTAADRVMAASKLVDESAEARRRGNRQQAIETLEKAEKIVADADLSERSTLIDELLRLVDEERAALSSGPATTTVPSLGPALIRAIPRITLARYREYRESLGRILIEERVPVELLAVALIESGFNPLALSSKGARGIWQFMPATAERYGLAVTAADDHRTHPEHSTRAAARYLRDLYQQFGDWKLALAAYNWGENNVQRIIAQTGVRDFGRMVQLGLLPPETRKYVPAVLAVWAQLSDNRAALQ